MALLFSPVRFGGGGSRVQVTRVEGGTLGRLPDWEGDDVVVILVDMWVSGKEGQATEEF